MTVAQYLDANPDLSPVVADAEVRLRAAFQPCDVETRIVNDPEGPQRLLVLAVTDMELHAAYVIHERLFTEWWCAIYPAVAGRMNVSFSCR